MNIADEVRHEVDHLQPHRPNGKGGPRKANGSATREPPERERGSPKPPPSYRDFTISAIDLDAKVFAPVRFVVQDILPVGLAILSAPPKVGKTWMDMGMSDDIAAGRVFGGCKATSKGQVLLLDLEGNERRGQGRFRKLRGDAKAPEGLLIANRWHRMGQGGVEMIRQWADDHPDRKAVFIDVWAAFRPVRPRNADAYQHDFESVRGLQELAHELGIAIVIVHHNRKAQDADWLNEISGSQGIAGAADTIIIIRRDRAAVDAVLHVTGRDVEEQELALRFDKESCRWSIIGDADEHRQHKTRQAIFGLLSAQGPMTPKQVADELGIPRNSVKSTMRRMREDGALRIVEAGKYACTKV
jgi:hypothetical protein